MMGEVQVQAEPTTQDVVIRCEFPVTPERLLAAYIDGEQAARWLGPRALQLVMETWDVRHGGAFRYRLERADGGTPIVHHGLFHGDPSVAAGVTQTWESSSAPGAVCLETLRVEPTDGGARLRLQIVYPGAAMRDAVVAGGLHARAAEMMALLAEVVEA
jgi:uncharacterized protein YndB with AHSA1/START domain